jgi:hypothetical protein
MFLPTLQEQLLSVSSLTLLLPVMVVSHPLRQVSYAQ